MSILSSSRSLAALVFAASVVLTQTNALGNHKNLPKPPAPQEPPKNQAINASADILGKSGSQLQGKAILTQVGKRLSIVIRIEKGIPGLHGVHIHEIGDCTDVNAKAAGEHFNPTNAQHGDPKKSNHHAGDLGNIDIKQDGKGTLEISTEELTLEPNVSNSIVNKAIVIHEKIDDLKTQPSGDSGSRIGCGVIQSVLIIPPTTAP